MATRKKIARPVRKAAKNPATKHFAGDKVGPHESIKTGPNAINSQETAAINSKLTASEAVYGFAGWLISREKPIIMSARHNAATVATMVNIFTDQQGLPAPREDWQKTLRPMKDIAGDVTNDPALSPTQVSPPPPTFDEAYQQVLKLFRGFCVQHQNHLVARLLEELKETRLYEFQVLSTKMEEDSNRHAQLADATKELDQVLSGNFAIVHV